MRVTKKGVSLTGLICCIALLALAIWGYSIGLIPPVSTWLATGTSHALLQPNRTSTVPANKQNGTATGSSDQSPATDSASSGVVNSWQQRISSEPLQQQQIERSHVGRLQGLASSYEGRLNTLIGAAWGEYSRSNPKGGKTSALAIARKYMAAGNSLESTGDAAFYAELDNFKSDLQLHHYPTTTATQAQQEYERSKAARKRQLLSSAAQQLL